MNAQETKKLRVVAAALVGMVFLGGLPACMEIRAVDPDQAMAPGSPNGSGIRQGRIVHEGGWNTYRVVVPATVPGPLLRRSLWVAEQKTFAPPAFLPYRAGADWTDQDVVPGATYRYEWGEMGEGRFEPKGFFEISVPMDLEVTGVVSPRDEVGQKLFGTRLFGLLIFRGEARVVTEGQDLELRAREIRFENSLVETFAPGTRASEGQPGRSGGVFQIHAERLTGSLHVTLRGEEGGNGPRGPAPGPELTGLPGQAGSSAELVYAGRVDAVVRYRCVVQPGPGYPGYRGRQGYPGGRGGDGGGAGRLLVTATDRQNFHLQVTESPGRGGAGGLGGPGGQGGPGGAGGSTAPSDRFSLVEGCQGAPAGPAGEEGPLGPVGPAGNDGPRGQVCDGSPGREVECRP